MESQDSEKIFELMKNTISQRGLSFVSLNEVQRGRQAAIFLIDVIDQETGKPAKFVLKLFSKDYHHNCPTAARHEFDVLEKFHNAVKNVNEITCPAPIAFYELDNGAYLMTYISGKSLEWYLAHTAIDFRDIVSRLLRGFQIYYTAVAEIYGDFQTKNVIIRECGSIGLIDPTMPNPFYHQFTVQCGPASIDMGYWLYTVAAGTAKLMVFNPKLCLRYQAFTRCLLKEAASVFFPAREHLFLEEVIMVALSHLDRLKKKSKFKKFLLYSIGKRVIKNMVGSKK